MIAEKAKKQQIRKSVPQKSAEQKPIDTREELAKTAGVSHDTIHRVETIENSDREDIKEAVKCGSRGKGYILKRNQSDFEGLQCRKHGSEVLKTHQNGQSGGMNKYIGLLQIANMQQQSKLFIYWINNDFSNRWGKMSGNSGTIQGERKGNRTKKGHKTCSRLELFENETQFVERGEDGQQRRAAPR